MHHVRVFVCAFHLVPWRVLSLPMWHCGMARCGDLIMHFHLSFFTTDMGPVIFFAVRFTLEWHHVTFTRRQSPLKSLHICP